MKILWADDQQEVVKTLAAEVLSAEWQVDFVADGSEALDALSSSAYDVVLLDLNMPPDRWGGLWLLEQVKVLNLPVPPVLVVSAEGTQLETIEALRLGATDYVLKERVQLELADRIKASVASRDRELGEQIRAGESERIEFKSTLRMNLHSGKVDPSMELACLKTVAGFLNGDGGTLFIGVADDGTILGLDPDKFPNEDRFQLHFWNLFRESIGSEFLGCVRGVTIQAEGARVFVVTCTRSPKPAFLKWRAPGENRGTEHFYVRAGPQTELLGTRQAVAYIKEHFS